MTDDTDNVVQLAPIRAAREEADDDEGAEFDAATLCWAVNEGESSFVALRTTWPGAEAEALEPDEADALAVALVRAAQKCREARGDE